jgi:hypothetical protein
MASHWSGQGPSRGLSRTTKIQYQRYESNDFHAIESSLMALVNLDHFDLTFVMLPSQFRAMGLGKDHWKSSENNYQI